MRFREPVHETDRKHHQQDEGDDEENVAVVGVGVGQCHRCNHGENGTGAEHHARQQNLKKHQQEADDEKCDCQLHALFVMLSQRVWQL